MDYLRLSRITDSIDRGYRLITESRFVSLFTKAQSRVMDIFNSIVEIPMMSFLHADNEELQRILNPFNNESRFGLLEGAIIHSSIYAPGERQESLQEFYSKTPGWWAAYDFRRVSQFGEKARSFQEGKLCTFWIDELTGNDKDELTRLGTLKFISNLEHRASYDFPGIEKLAEQGFVELKTYEDAYAHAGLGSQYSSSLGLLELSKKPVYAVTPKGNGMIFLINEGGEKTPKADCAKKFAFQDR